MLSAAKHLVLRLPGDEILRRYAPQNDKVTSVCSVLSVVNYHQ
jgi:hypothetical protein